MSWFAQQRGDNTSSVVSTVSTAMTIGRRSKSSTESMGNQSIDNVYVLSVTANPHQSKFPEVTKSKRSGFETVNTRK